MDFLFEGLIHRVNLVVEAGWIVKGKFVFGWDFTFLARISLFFGTDFTDYTVLRKILNVGAL